MNTKPTFRITQNSFKLVAFALAFLFAGCMGLRPSMDSGTFQESTRRLTIPSLRVEFQVPESWTVEYSGDAIETNAADLYPSMRFAPAPNRCSYRHISDLKQELSEMIYKWNPVKSQTVNGMNGYSWEGFGREDALEYTILVWLLENQGGCMVAVMFTPNDVYSESRVRAEPVFQSIRPY